ncbi:MAG: hypothetical protein U9N85_08695 [Bacteroidota bacterium]|nr:hypothetical protein [Bacteroidota bacterium]
MKNKFLIVTALFLSTIVSFAQDNTGSPFSGFGYGIIEDQGIGGAMGYGGASIGLAQHDQINILNPAGYSAIAAQSFIFHAGYRAKRVDFTDASSSSSKYNYGFTGINTAFRINEFWAAGFGLTPFSSIGYNVKTEENRSFENTSYDITTNYYGEGGLNKLYFSTAFDYEGFSVGADFSYIFGLTSIRTEAQLQDSLYTNLILHYENYNTKGLLMTYGIQYSYDIAKYKKLTLGVTYNMNTKLSADYTAFASNFVSNNYNTVSDTIMYDTISNINTEIPQKIGIGLSYKGKKFLFAADFSSQSWEGVPIFGEQTENLKNSYKIAGGMEFLPSRTAQSYFKAVKYRLGGYYSNSYISYNGNPVEEYGLTFGFGLPAKKSLTYINLGFEVGVKGSVEKNLLKENYYGLNLSINMADIWFVKRKFE